LTRGVTGVGLGDCEAVGDGDAEVPGTAVGPVVGAAVSVGLQAPDVAGPSTNITSTLSRATWVT
jgi:hypothetical protein